MAEPMSTRPKYLDLTSIRLPLSGKVSILHRISGFGLFVILPFLLIAMSHSLASEQGFAAIKQWFTLWPVKLIAIVLILAYVQHLCSGVRFLLLDIHIGVEKTAANRSSLAVFVLSIALTLLIAWRILPW